MILNCWICDKPGDPYTVAGGIYTGILKCDRHEGGPVFWRKDISMEANEKPIAESAHP
jgi:hypothetical protein